MTSRFSRLAVAGFELFFRPWLRRRVEAIRVTGLPDRLPSRPLLLVANHVSWWDPFVLREVQRSLRPRAPLYTLMSRQELRRRPFFRLMGVVGIDADAPVSVARALRFLEGRLERRPDATVLYFPQGRIWPSHRRPLGFRRGIELFARRLPAVILPVGLHVEPLNRVSPTVFVSAGDIVEGEPPGAGELERRVERELDRILELLAVHGEDAPGAWPGPHDRLGGGTAREPTA